jgi:cytochrome c oxidase assembly factor CtaG
MGGVVLALPRPGGAQLLAEWTMQPLAMVLVLLLAAGYVRGVRRLGRRWPVLRSVAFFLGLAVLTWATCGFPQVYADRLYWVWTSQTLLLWLVVPILVLSGHPVQLAAATSRSGRIQRVLNSRSVRTLGNPLVGPALVPVLSMVLFFGPLPGWAIASAPVGWLLQLGLIGVGAIMVLPLVGLDEEASSLAVGLSLAIGSFELVLDALPGVILRLHRQLATTWFDHRVIEPWSVGSLHDQQIAGAILWCIAEVIDLPFMVLVFRRWLRADARDAARVDAVLEAERAARKALAPEEDAPAVEQDAPWWLSDPTMQERMRRRE